MSEVVTQVVNVMPTEVVFEEEMKIEDEPITIDNRDVTEKVMLVSSFTKEVIESWNSHHIVDALIREANIPQDLASEIAQSVENKIKLLNLDKITTHLIRELVNTELINRGLQEYANKHRIVGLPVKDLTEILIYPNNENSNTDHNPEAVNLTIAEMILKQYSFEHWYPSEVVDAHLKGYIHIHDAGMPNRPYCSGQSVAYVAKHGLNVPSITSVSKPAKHPESLIAHILKMTSVLQNHFAGAIGWDAFNMFLAPYTIELSDKDLKQLLQMTIFEFNQLAGGRGGQVAFTDLNLYWNVPKHFRETPVILPGGVVDTSKSYVEYEKEMQRILKFMFEVYMEGDACGKPFFFPKPLLHINDEFLSADNADEGLYIACELAATMGNTYFVFDRGTAKLSECCRLQFELTEEDLKETKEPWLMRYSAIQNVSINLPRLAYESGSLDDFKSKLMNYMDLAVVVHKYKRKLIKKLLKYEDKGPLALLTMKLDGKPYFRWEKLSHLIGIVGLNEAVWKLTGKQLDDPEAHEVGLDIIKFMSEYCDLLSNYHGFKIVLEQTPAESTANRFALLDVNQYAIAENYVSGQISDEESIYYTNSTHLPYHLDIDPITRVYMEGEYHPYIKAGAITHLWIGEQRPSTRSLVNFIKKVHHHTQNTQIAISPEFTVCYRCNRTSRGRHEKCPYCNSKKVDIITRITGYFTRVSSWNKGKKAELNRRKKPVV